MADINPDLAAMSTEQLLALRQQAVSNMAINQNESGGAPDTATGIVNPASGARGSMQVLPTTAQNPGFGVQPSNGTPQDDARVGRDYHAALTQKYGDPETAAIAYNMGPAKTDNWIANGRDLSTLPTETLKYLKNFKTTVQANQPVMNNQSSGNGPAPVAMGAPDATPPVPSPTMTQQFLRQLGLTARATGHGVADAAGALTQGFTRAMGVPDERDIINNLVNKYTPAPQGALENGVQAVGAAAANPVNYLPGLGGAGLVRGAAGGAMAAGMQPTAPGATPTQVGGQMAAGAVGGGLMGGLGNAMNGMRMSPAAQSLVGQGVTLTPGQAAGGVLNKMEQMGTSIPVVGPMIQNARNAATRQMNTALGNQVLAPIGQTVEKDVPTRDLVSTVGQKISDEYDRILPQVTFKADTQLKRDMTPIYQQVATMPPDIQNAFNGIIDRNFGSQIKNGQMSGTAFKDADSVLGKEAANFKGSSDAFQRNLGGALQDAQTVMRNSLERTNPNAPTLGPINQAWRNYTVMRNAGTRVNNPEAPIAAGQLQAAVKAGDKSVGKGAFSRGQANMQDLADNSMAVLGNSVPDSGTAGRSALMGMPAALGGLGYAAMHGQVLPAAAAAAGGLAGMAGYGTNAGRQAMLAALVKRPTEMGYLAGGAAAGAPAMGAAAAGLLDPDRNRDAQ